MQDCSSVRSTIRHSWLATIGMVFWLGCVGCNDVFSAQFLQLFESDDPDGNNDGSSAFVAVDPPKGHIPIIFKNEVRMADDVFSFLVQGNTAVPPEVVDEILRFNPSLTAAEVEAILDNVAKQTAVNLELLRNIPPRIRLTVDVTNSKGGVQRLEFLDGLKLVRGEDQVAGTPNIADLPPELTQNTSNKYVVQCDIDKIEIVGIEVFVPVVIRQLQTVTINAGGGTIIQFDDCSAFEPPQFRTLQEDTNFSAQQGGFTTIQNYDPRNFPEPLENIGCGSVIELELIGDLTLPFRIVPEECLPEINPPKNTRTPGYFTTNAADVNEALRIPGRYGVSIRVIQETNDE